MTYIPPCANYPEAHGAPTEATNSHGRHITVETFNNTDLVLAHWRWPGGYHDEWFFGVLDDNGRFEEDYYHGSLGGNEDTARRRMAVRLGYQPLSEEQAALPPEDENDGIVTFEVKFNTFRNAQSALRTHRMFRGAHWKPPAGYARDLIALADAILEIDPRRQDHRTPELLHGLAEAAREGDAWALGWF